MLVLENVQLVADPLELAIRSLKFVVLLLRLALEVRERCLELLVQILGVGLVLVDVHPQLLALRISLFERLDGVSAE